MAVNTTNIVSGPYSGNGLADTFNYTFPVKTKEQLTVFETDDNGVETTLTVDTDYTVTGVGDAGGGTVVRTAGALPTGYTWYIRSNYQQTQLTSFTSQGAFFPVLHEDAIDKVTLLIQQLQDAIDRSMKVSDSFTGALPLSIEDPEASKIIRWKTDLTGFENVDFTDLDQGAYSVGTEPGDIPTNAIVADTTVSKTQDDYDRSPLFVDGTDFTAGAGPHVINVPAAWTPSASDARFYKLDTTGAGTVTTITPSATTTSSFTVNETLLATDVLFIGDDRFKNQFDGDPADNRTRLDVYSKSETYTQAEVDSIESSLQSNIDAKQDSPAAATGFTFATAYAISEDGDSVGGNLYDIDANVTASAWESFGPTGSSQQNIWSALDNIPDAAKFIDVIVDQTGNPATTSGQLEVWARKKGSTTGVSDIRLLLGRARTQVSSGNITSFNNSVSGRIVLNGSRQFEFRYISTGISNTINMKIVGFGV